MQIQNEIKRIKSKYQSPEAKSAINELSRVFAQFLEDFVAKAKSQQEATK